MSQFIFFLFPNVIIKCGFTNRTHDKKAENILVQLIPHIKREIELVKKLRLSYSEMMHLKKQGIFKDEYLDFLSTMNLCDVNVFEKDGLLQIEYEGNWAMATIWETLVLSIVAELYARYTATEKYADDNLCSGINHALNGDDKEFLDLIFKPYYENAMVLLEEKIQAFLHHPNIEFFEFGTRRRFTAELQEMVVKRLSEVFVKPQFHGAAQFLGTSNEYLAMKLGLTAGGTCAHEIFMVAAGLEYADDTALVNSQYDVLRKWFDFYGYNLSVALTDTFGSEYFFKNCPEDIAQKCSFREDSAIDLYAYTEMVLDLYSKYKIPLRNKIVVHSNGLNKNKVIEQDSYSTGKIHKIYGIGTDLSCDVGLGFLHLSMVIKVIYVWVDEKWIPVIKLSDNLAKSIGPKDEVDRYKKLHGYVNELSETQIY